MISYENNIKELNDIMEKLKAENISIEESIRLFERAGGLYKECREYLDKAKGDVFKIKLEMENYTEQKFE